MSRTPSSPAGPPSARESQTIPFVESFLLLFTVVGLLATLGGFLQERLGFAGLAATEIVVVAAPAIALALLLKLPASALGLRSPNLRSLVGAALVGAGGFYLVAAVVEAAIERIVPVPPSVRAELTRLILPATGPRPLALDLLVLAVLPAACEELVFRGALLEAWRRGEEKSSPDRSINRSSNRSFNHTARTVAAVGGAALAFGIFHLSLFKLVPTAALGLFAGIIAVRAASAIPAMVFHAVNNLLVVVLVHAGIEEPPSPGTRLGVVCLVGSIVAVAVGLWLVRPTNFKKCQVDSEK